MDSKQAAPSPPHHIPELVGPVTVEGLGCETEEKGYIRQDLEGTSRRLWTTAASLWVRVWTELAPLSALAKQAIGLWLRWKRHGYGTQRLGCFGGE